MDGGDSNNNYGYDYDDDDRRLKGGVEESKGAGQDQPATSLDKVLELSESREGQGEEEEGKKGRATSAVKRAVNTETVWYGLYGTMAPTRQDITSAGCQQAVCSVLCVVCTVHLVWYYVW